ncbi:NAD(P)/FAD-dependent oxidoreductase [Rheinheimera baltica]|uniref:NAD(P)/FAD-dependent oxidoreductase n=1 Tax=Rheinheimera baltica TaxID=67576 RepID=UPI00273FEE06|nr:FAD-dependent oxidoreductase [Rheinheimera baltica]MDP5188796.1 FAD-dependent oxidoreductase [Rheinheimera baltica]
MTIAVIGAGIAGAACASELVKQGLDVVVFDKGRSAGGRMSSKRTPDGYLDLGAQYFTARAAAFKRQCENWLTLGVITPWQGRLAIYENGTLCASPDQTTRYIGLPSMQKPVQQLLQQVKLNSPCRVDTIKYDGTHWQLYSDEQHLGHFSQLVIALPQQQAAMLLAEHLLQQPQLQALFNAEALLPCWSVNIELDAATSVPFDGIFVKGDNAVSWLARQSSKTGRAPGEQWLVHFSPAFSQLHLEADAAQMSKVAVAELQRMLGDDISVVQTLCHRWRYAQQAPDYPVHSHIYHTDLSLGLCGDWLNGGRVENAWLSGYQLARALRYD